MSVVFAIIALAILLVGGTCYFYYYHRLFNRAIAKSIRNICKQAKVKIIPQSIRLERVRLKYIGKLHFILRRHYIFDVDIKGEQHQGKLVLVNRDIDSCFIERPFSKKNQEVDLKKAANEECNVIKFPKR